MTTAPQAHEPPFALDGTVTLTKLRELLAVQTELTWLDYKQQCDLSTGQGTAELVKDIGAMMILGGYLVVGATDIGAPTGLTDKQAVDFDEATLSAKIAKYLPHGFEVRSAVHEVSTGGTAMKLALVWVAPHPDGWCIFTRDGDYVVNGKPKQAFRRGDVYARHGTRSEPWQQPDVDRARTHLVARVKDSWRTEMADEIRRASAAASVQAATAAGPSASYTWQLDVDAFEAATVELLRRGDDIPVRRMCRAAEADAKALRDSGNEPDFATLLDRLSTVAALALDLRRPQFLKLALDAFSVIFDAAVTDRTSPMQPDIPEAVAALRLAERLFALGALAVRLEDWPAVRALALLPVPHLDSEGRPQTWHRHTLTEASRASLLQQGSGKDARTLSLLLFARAVTSDHPALHPDLPSDATAAEDPLLTSLCQFDLLATIVCGVEVRARTEQELLRVSYPNFGQFDSRRVPSVVRALITATAERIEVLPDASDEDLALVLYLADQAARKAGRAFFGWQGYQDQVVIDFVEQQVRLSDGQLFQ